MPARSALVRLAGAAADQIVHDFLASQGFVPAPPTQAACLRRYVTKREFRDVEIALGMEGPWTSEGGLVRIAVRSYVHPVIQVLGPRSFELGPHADGTGAWKIREYTDVTRFAEGLFAYLRDVAVPWLGNTQSQEAVLKHLEDMKHLDERDTLRAAWAGATEERA